jgi:hypothetical protein
MTGGLAWAARALKARSEANKATNGMNGKMERWGTRERNIDPPERWE